MSQSLYNFYLHSSLNLYDIRKHYLEHFYYQNHSKKEARSVLNTVIDSSKVTSLIKESLRKRKAPTCEEFTTTINSILKLMLKSKETQVLAVIDATLRWDIEVNSLLELVCSEELKEDIVRIFKINPIYEEISEEKYSSENNNFSEEIEDGEYCSIKNANENLKIQSKTTTCKRVSKLKTWSLASFTAQFGKMQVAAFTNRMTGELFVSCVCTKGKKKTYVAFSSKLGELTPEEIEEMENELAIVQLPSGRYCLAKPKNGIWKDVDI